MKTGVDFRPVWRIVMVAVGIFLAPAGMAASPASGEAPALLPTPKRYVSSGMVRFPRDGYTLECRIPGVEPEEMLADGLRYCGWKPMERGGVGIAVVPDQKLTRPEEYMLSIRPEGIVVRAGSAAGAWRGVGRLLAVVTGPGVRVDKDAVCIPGGEIHDWPDIATRAMKLEFPRRSGAALMERVKPVIRSLAMFGFNIVFFDLRGELECKSHPEIVVKPALPQRDVAELIRYARQCGLEVLPMTNSIGHLNRSPQIFPLEDISTNAWHSRGRRATVAMNIAHPEFYRVFFDYLDEVCDLFGRPRYFMIGCDEFHDGLKMLEKSTGKSMPEYFSEFLLRTDAHMRERNQCRIIIWQDMLFEQQVPWFINAPSNGPKGAEQVMDKLPADFPIAMWKYEWDPVYPQLKALRERGFTDLWCAPWFNPRACAALSRQAYEAGTKVLGTTWWIHPHAQGIPTVAEFAWNAAGGKLRSDDFYDAVIDHFYYGRGTAVPPENVRAVPVFGGGDPGAQWKALVSAVDSAPVRFTAPRTFETPETALQELEWPWDFKRLEAEGKLGRLLLAIDSSAALLRPEKPAVNRPRAAGSFVFYTPEWGKSTGSNFFGSEIAVTDGRVSALSGRETRYEDEKGNMAIPVNGVVFSRHGKQFRNSTNRPGRGWKPALGDRVRLFLEPEPGAFAAQNIRVPFSGERRRAMLFLATRRPVEPEARLAAFRMDTATGAETAAGLMGWRFLVANDQQLGNWRFHLLPGTDRRTMNPVLCLEWCGEAGSLPKQAIITSTAAGEASGLTVLGAMEFD